MRSDIEDFTTEELRTEIQRRVEAHRNHKCWYCSQNLSTHTCKYAAGDNTSPVPGWTVDPPRYISTEDCMANEIEYWQTNARNSTTGECVIGNGKTPDDATEHCLKQITGRMK